MESMNVLILAGGHSSRMGSSKHLLSLSNGPLYKHLIQVLHEVVPAIETMHFSVAERSEIDEDLRKGVVELGSQQHPKPKSVKLQLVMDDTTEDVGPAAGLIAAHHTHPATAWLVIACDYPLLEAAAIRQLLDHYEVPATCFKNSEGFSEPLLGIWSSQALRTLEENVNNGRLGPSFTLRQLQAKLITPLREDWLTNVNYKSEWEAAKVLL